MIELTDATYKEFVEDFFRNNKKPLVIFYGSPNCINCKKTIEFYNEFVTQHANVIEFAYMNYTLNHILDREFGEFYNMYEYPKTVIFYNMEDKDFMQGLVTVDKMLEIKSKSQE